MREYRRATAALIALALVSGCSGDDVGPPDPTPITGSLAGIWTCSALGTSATTVEFEFVSDVGILAGTVGYWWIEGAVHAFTWEAVSNDRLNLVETPGLPGPNTITGFLGVISNNQLQGNFADQSGTLNVVCTR